MCWWLHLCYEVLFIVMTPLFYNWIHFFYRCLKWPPSSEMHNSVLLRKLSETLLSAGLTSKSYKLCNKNKYRRIVLVLGYVYVDPPTQTARETFYGNTKFDFFS